MTATNNATNISTGALQVAGGLSTGSDAHVGGNLRVHSSTDASNASSGAMVVDGGLGVGGKAYVGGNLYREREYRLHGRELWSTAGEGVVPALPEQCTSAATSSAAAIFTVAGSITGNSPITIAATNTPVGDKTMTVSGDSPQTTGNMYVGGDVVGIPAVSRSWATLFSREPLHGRRHDRGLRHRLHEHRQRRAHGRRRSRRHRSSARR